MTCPAGPCFVADAQFGRPTELSLCQRLQRVDVVWDASRHTWFRGAPVSKRHGNCLFVDVQADALDRNRFMECLFNSRSLSRLALARGLAASATLRFAGSALSAGSRRRPGRASILVPSSTRHSEGSRSESEPIAAGFVRLDGADTVRHNVRDEPGSCAGSSRAAKVTRGRRCAVEGGIGSPPTCSFLGLAATSAELAVWPRPAGAIRGA
jgi:hypothetical protein